MFPVNAKIPDTITKEQEYQSFDSDEIYPFAELIQEGNAQYRLSETTYKIINKKSIEVSTEIKVDIKSDPIPEKKKYEAEKEIEQDGIKLKLVSSTPDKTIIKGKVTVPYSATTTYDYNISDSQIPKEKEVEVGTKKIKLPLKSIMMAESKWVDTTIRIIYTNYNSEFYMLDDIVIPHTVGKPALKGYEDKIIEGTGHSTQNYQISDIVWDGEPYKNAAGVTCRNAVAYAKMLVNGKIALYQDEALTVESSTNVTVYTNHYVGTKSIDTGKTEYRILATATYDLYDMNVGLKTALTIVSLLFVVSLTIAIILVILAKKKNVKGEKHG